MHKVHEKTRIESMKHLHRVDISGARGIPMIPISYIYANRLFPTPIIISFASPSFLTDPYPFRCAWDSKPALYFTRCRLVVIDRNGDRSPSTPRLERRECTTVPLSILRYGSRSSIKVFCQLFGQLRFKDVPGGFNVARGCVFQTHRTYSERLGHALDFACCHKL